MSDEQIALARRAVACKGWRWMGGMLRCSPVLEKAYSKWEPDVMPTERVLDRHPLTYADKRWSNASNAWVQMLPDLTDAATLGCLLALVREALNSPRVHVLYVEGLYRWECADNRTVHGVGATEAEALIETLEYAP